MVRAMASFVIPTPSARKVVLVISVSAHVDKVGEGMEPTVLVSREKLVTSAKRNRRNILNNKLASLNQ